MNNKLISWVKNHKNDIYKQWLLLNGSGVIGKITEIREKQLIGEILETDDKKKINWYYNGIQFLKEKENTGD